MNLEKLTSLAADLPEPYKTTASALVVRMGEVLEGIGDNPVKWRAPTAKLIQAVSDRSKLPKGASIGSIVIGENVLDQPGAVIVLRSWNARQYWSPDQNEAKMICSSPDATLGYIGLKCNECPHSKFDEEAKKIDCNKIKVFMVIKADLSDIFLVQFSKTGFKIGTEWEQLMKKAGVAPYRRVYGLKSETSKQYKNVETLAIETFDTDEKKNTPTELIPFVTELFTQVGADRKEMVDQFHTIILSRKSDTNLLTSNAGADSEVVLLGTDAISDVEDVTVTSKPVKSGTESKSGMAKKYVV